MELYDIISETAKKYIEENQIVFEDWQKAWLFYHSDRNIKEIHLALDKIAKETKDAQLKEQIFS